MTNKRGALFALIAIALACIPIALLLENRANKKCTKAVQEFADNLRALSISMNVGDKAFLKVNSYGTTEVVFLDPYETKEDLKGVLPEYSDNAIQELYDISNSDYGFALVWVNNGRIQHYGAAVLNLTCYMDAELGRAPAKMGTVQVAVVKLRRENGNITLRLSF